MFLAHTKLFLRKVAGAYDRMREVEESVINRSKVPRPASAPKPTSQYSFGLTSNNAASLIPDAPIGGNNTQSTTTGAVTQQPASTVRAPQAGAASTTPADGNTVAQTKAAVPAQAHMNTTTTTTNPKTSYYDENEDAEFNNGGPMEQQEQRQQQAWFDSMKRQAQSGAIRNYSHMLDLDEANSFQGTTNQDRWNMLSNDQRKELRNIWKGRKDHTYAVSSMDDVRNAHLANVNPVAVKYTHPDNPSDPNAMTRVDYQYTPQHDEIEAHVNALKPANLSRNDPTLNGSNGQTPLDPNGMQQMDIYRFLGDSQDPGYQERMRALQMYSKAFPGRYIDETREQYLKRTRGQL